jgi:hypothetical protein
MNTEELEAAVRAAWDREAIAIYADHLQAIGDPRGELVAIDLRIDEGNVDAAITARREQLIAEWFGADLPPGIVHYGFVDVRATGMRSDSQLAVALRGPGAKYVRSVELAGPHPELVPALEQLVAEPRPWLTKLVVHQWQDQREPTLTHGLVDVLPALTSLEISGRNVLDAPAHPNVQRLRVTGFDAHSALLDSTTIWSALTTLDLAFHCQYTPAPAALTNEQLATLLPARCVPALRELDLSRNGRGVIEPHSHGGAVQLGPFLARYARHPWLSVLHLPRLEPDARLQRSLDDLPALRELVVYDTPPNLMPKHRSARMRALAR